MFKALRLSEEGTKNLKKAVVASVITNLTMFFPFIIIMQIIQALINPLANGQPLDTRRLWLFMALGIGALILYFIANSYEYDKTYTTSYKESTKIRVEVAEHMRKLPLSFFNRKDLSELTTNIMGDCETIEQTTSHIVPGLFANGITITLISAMMAFYDWRMALALFCALPFSAGIIILSRGVQEKFGERHVKAKLHVSDQVQEYLDGIKVVKAFGLSGEKSAALKKALRQMMKEAIVFEGIAGTLATSAMMILQVGTGLVILVGVNLLTTGEIQMVPFLTFAMVSARIFAPLIAIFTMLPEFFYLLVSTRRMQQLRTEPVMEGTSEVSLPDYSIRFENVSFAYNNIDVIKDMSFSLPGGVTALVGPSGSGKSTVSRLVARFWDVNKGKVFVGGQEIKNIEPEALMKYMSFVFQDVVLFNDTVMNNIRIGKQGASDEEVRRAAKIARCDEFIENMPESYNTLVGENGCTLSGGERQRISIARALLKDAPIVLLDEATSSLDPENEVLIQEAISELIKGRSVIVIAHRLKTIAGADRILVLEDGRLVQQGTHDELIKQRGLYAHLWNEQQTAAGWRIKREMISFA